MATDLTEVRTPPPQFRGDTYRILPIPNICAILNFQNLSLQPPRLEQIFLAVAIGPSLGDIHAQAVVGIPKEARDTPGLIEVLESFAISDKAYIALCEGLRSILEPLNFHTFTGTINMLSTLMPMRVTEKRPFYTTGIIAPGGRA